LREVSERGGEFETSWPGTAIRPRQACLRVFRRVAGVGDSTGQRGGVFLWRAGFPALVEPEILRRIDPDLALEVGGDGSGEAPEVLLERTGPLDLDEVAGEQVAAVR